MVLKEPGTHQECVLLSCQTRCEHTLTSLAVFQGERFTGAMSVIKSRAPVTGGNFGVWGGMFSTFDCAIKGWRQKEDAWNAIASGFLTGGCLAARSTPFLPLHLPAYSCRSNERWTEVCSWFSNSLRYSFGCVRGCWCLGFQDHERQYSSSTPSPTRKHATTTVIIAVPCFRLDHHYKLTLPRIYTYSELPLMHLYASPSQGYRFSWLDIVDMSVAHSSKPSFRSTTRPSFSAKYVARRCLHCRHTRLDLHGK